MAEEFGALKVPLERKDSSSGLTMGVSAEDKAKTAILNRRIAEVQRDQRAESAAELLHLQVIHDFRHQLQVPLVPPLPRGGKGAEPSAVDLSPVDPKRLAPKGSIYSEDAMDLLRDHVLSIIGEWTHLTRDYPLQLATYQAAKVYALSCHFGYSLQRAETRFRLDKQLDPARAPASLMEYVSRFGLEEAQQVSQAASHEAERVVERQVSLLFGDAEELQQEVAEALHPAPEDEDALLERLREAVMHGEVASMTITVRDLRRLALEGAAFGKLLARAESKAQSLYDFTPGMMETPIALLGSGMDQGSKLSGFRLFGA